ncbi:hypothetical protein PSPO01_00558 [Paraphaeosphaeria sporulosa]
MKATAIILVISTLFGSTTLACRCASWGPTLYYDYQNTKDCCYQLNGAFYDGDPNGKEYDCQAASISEKLSSFHHCCWYKDNNMRGDCKWPGK